MIFEMSPDGKVHNFDESGNGYCHAEGCGALMAGLGSEDRGSEPWR
jgi:acyl transferase domain-containing protein